MGLALCLLFALAGCNGIVLPEAAPEPEVIETPTATPAPTPSPSPTPDPTPTPTPEPPLFAFDGVVEHIFFHPLIYDAELAFGGWKAEGLDDWMVTVSEYNKILQSLYEKGFILVHLTDVYEERIEDGMPRMVRKELLLPEGKKPIVISFDDVNYYDYMREFGFVYKLILGDDGEIWDFSIEKDGTERITQERDIITILDAFVKENPDFSWRGAKGCIGLTGFDGILGYQTQEESENRQAEIEAVRPIVARLKESGWMFASHSFGHPDFVKISQARLVHDATRWHDEVESIIGPTPVLLYPYGADCQKDPDKMKTLFDHGFRIFCAVGIDSYVRISETDSAVFMDRRHPDGTTLRWRRSGYLDLYDAKEVFDPARPDRPLDFSR